MFKTNIRITNMPQVIARLEDIASKLSNVEVAHKKISVLLDKWVQDNFKTEGGKVGGWAPLKAGGRWVGKKNKRRLDTSAKILRKTTELQKSFIPFSNKKNAGIGSELPYSKPHDEGIGIVQRRILPLASEVKADIVNEFEKHIKESAK